MPKEWYSIELAGTNTLEWEGWEQNQMQGCIKYSTRQNNKNALTVIIVHPKSRLINLQCCIFFHRHGTCLSETT